MNALVRLANGLARRGLSLAAGDLVTSSNIYNEPVRPAAGDVIVADFGVLGNIEVTFG